MNAIAAAQHLNSFLGTGNKELQAVDREICDAIGVFEICEKGADADVLLSGIVAVALACDLLMTEDLLMKYCNKLKPVITKEQENELYELLKMKFPDLTLSSE